MYRDFRKELFSLQTPSAMLVRKSIAPRVFRAFGERGCLAVIYIEAPCYVTSCLYRLRSYRARVDEGGHSPDIPLASPNICCHVAASTTL